jgi:hypothetical protein
MNGSHRPSSVARRARRVARGLGWLSLALGVAELLLPRQVARVPMLRGDRDMLRARGLRDIAAGAALLATTQLLHEQAQRPVHDYSDRRGLPLPPNEMRGAALLDFDMPADMRTPIALQAFVTEP